MNPPSMTTHTCHRCQQLIPEDATRFVAKIQVHAAGGPIKISSEDLLTNQKPEIARLLEQCDSMSEEELMKDVLVEFEFNLCRPCQRAYIANPLPAEKL